MRHEHFFSAKKPSKSQILQPPHYQGHTTSIHGEENGARVERTTYDDPETRTHVEEVKIEKTEEEPEKEAHKS